MAYSVSVTELGAYKGPMGKSPMERWLPEGHFQAYRRLACDWTDRWTLLDEISLNGGELYPHNPGTGARAYSATTLGFGQTSQGATASEIAYEKAEVTVYYSTRILYIGGGLPKLVTEELTDLDSAVPVSTDALRWTSGSGQIVEPNAGIVKPVAGFLYAITFHHAASIPAAALTFKDGCNNAPMGSWTLGLTFAAETLWYKGFRARRTLSLAGFPDWRIQFRFAANINGWNKRWLPGTGWDDIYHAGTGNRVIFHPLVDFNLLAP